MPESHWQIRRTEQRGSICRSRITPIALALLLALSNWLAEAFGEKSDIKLLTPSINGSTGLFTLPVAETMRRGEFVLGWNSRQFHRDPGALSYTVFPTSFSVGIHDRIELFASFETYKRISGSDVLVYKVAPGDRLLPAYVASANMPGYFNEAPFIDVPFGDGRGELWSGVKLNVLSERGTGCFSLALQPVVRFDTSLSRQQKLRGLTSGTFDAGLDIVASKRMGRRITLAGKVGVLSGRNVEGVARQNELEWGVGIEWSLIKNSLRFIGELTGRNFVGEKESELVNIAPPIDAHAGARIRAASWLTLSGALTLHLRNAPGSHHNIVGSNGFGWIFQASFQRKINRPPTIQCRVEQKRVSEGDIVAIHARPSDSDDDLLWLSWKASGGRLLQQDGSVLLDTSGLEPGRYSVMAEAGDDAGIASCSVDIEVVERD